MKGSLKVVGTVQYADVARFGHGLDYSTYHDKFKFGGLLEVRDLPTPCRVTTTDRKDELYDEPYHRETREYFMRNMFTLMCFPSARYVG